MKYLIMTNHSYMLWQFRRELISELLRHGEVLISTPFVGHEEDFAEMGCRMIETKLERRGMNPLHDMGLFRFYHQLLKSEVPDLVMTYSIKPNVYGGYACRMLGIRYCVNVQGLGTAFQKRGIAQLAGFMYREALRNARAVFFENRGNAAFFLKKKIVPKERIVVVPGAGVNLDFFPQMPYPSEEGGIHFLHLGRIMKEKGVDEFFFAAREIKKKYGDRVIFDVVGFFEEEYKETIDTLVKDQVIVFHGFQEEPRPYYTAAHCVVLPSYHEGMSNVLLEGASTGRALITSDIPGCREAVENGVTGFLCRVRDAEGLRDRMDAFIQLSEAERRDMGLNGRRRMEKRFDRKKVVKKICQNMF